MVSARMNSRSKSLWITPAALEADAPCLTDHDLASFGPTNEKQIIKIMHVFQECCDAKLIMPV